ncbi:MAG TPA: TIGR03435 family protein [Bryobacteraceae bacterium]|jgi:uncharacterized protein (TIGR03435 family)|nr:TIGR03435 family protein [Bryobacteraceae bacterium]
MKKRIYYLALLAASTSGLFAQTFKGTWQGGLKIPQAPNGELRIVMKIETNEKDALSAEFYSIDQNPTPIKAESVKTSGQGIKVNIPTLNGAFEGTLSSDGNTINGTFTQGAPTPLVLVKATPATAWTIPEPPPPPKMMDANAKPQFEVATIKPSNPNRPGWGIGINPSGMVNTLNTTLADLMKFCYDLHPKQVVNAPAWFDTEKFDVSGKPDTPGMASLPQMKAMMQQLIVDRFGLKFHDDKRELQAYAITVAKGGAKVKKEENVKLPLPGFGGAPQRGFNIRNATIAEFGSVMQAQFMDLPVVDQTGLGDTRYTFVLKFTPDPGMRPFGGAAPPGPPPAPDADAPPDLYAAMEQQLGLRMQKTRTNVPVMVIDKIDKPSAN